MYKKNFPSWITCHACALRLRISKLWFCLSTNVFCGSSQPLLT